MTASGKLQPKLRRNVIVSVPGDVVKVHKKQSELVQEGETLLTLENSDLDSKIIQLEGKIKETKTSHDVANRQRQDKSKSAAERNSASQQKSSLAIELESQKLELKELQRQIAKLNVVSPINGKVLDFRPEELLKSRPLSRGEKVYTIADINGEWELDLSLIHI